MRTGPQKSISDAPLPPSSRSHLCTNSDDPARSIVICIQDAIERRLLAGAFEALKWVVSAHASLWASSQDARGLQDPTITLLDRADLVSEAREQYSRSDIVVLCDGTEEAVAMAWESVPDGLITRPIDPLDPLGLRDLGDAP